MGAIRSCGRIVRPDNACNSLLSVLLPLHGSVVAISAVYTPHSRHVGDQRAHYTHCLQQHRALSAKDCLQIWGGDWNGHVAKVTALPLIVVSMVWPALRPVLVVRFSVSGSLQPILL